MRNSVAAAAAARDVARDCHGPIFWTRPPFFLGDHERSENEAINKLLISLHPCCFSMFFRGYAVRQFFKLIESIFPHFQKV